VLKRSVAMTTLDLETATALHLDALSKIHSLCLPRTASFETKRLVRYLETHLQASSSSTATSTGAANSSSAQIASNSNARGHITPARGGLWGEPAFAAPTSDAGALKTAPKRRGPLGLRLKKLLPSWHAIHNERCWKCGILSVPGINATYQAETEETMKRMKSESQRKDKLSQEKDVHAKLIRQCLHCGAKRPRDMPSAQKKRQLKQLRGKDGRGLSDKPIVIDDSSPVRMDTSMQSSRSASSSILSSSPIISFEKRASGKQSFEPRTPARPEAQGKPGNLLRQVFTPHTPARDPVTSASSIEETSPAPAASVASTEKAPAQKHMTLDQIAALKRKENKRKRKEVEADDTSSPAAKQKRMAGATQGDDSSVSQATSDVPRARPERTEEPREDSVNEESSGTRSSSTSAAPPPVTNATSQNPSMSTAANPGPVTPARPLSLDERAALAKAEKKRQKKEAKAGSVAAPSAGSDGASKASGSAGRSSASSSSSRSASASPFASAFGAGADKSALKAMLQAEREKKKAQSGNGSAKPQSGLRNVFG
jgi:hypothetical protein